MMKFRNYDENYGKKMGSILSSNKNNMDFFLTNEESAFDELIKEEEKKNGILRRFFNFRILNLLILSVSFFLLFGAYNISVNFMTSIHQDVGAASVGIICLSFSICNLIAPTMIAILGSKICIPIGFAIYSLYVICSALPTPKSQSSNFIDMATQIYDVYKCFDNIDQQSLVQQCLYDRGYSFIMANYGAFIILLVSPLVGFGAAITWASQGAYVTAIAYDPVTEKTETGFYSGSFFSIYQSNLIFCNAFAVGMLYFDFPMTYVFIAMFFVGVAGTVVSCLLWPYNANSKDDKDENKKKNSKNMPKKQATRSAYMDIELEERGRGMTPLGASDSIFAKILKGVGKKIISVAKDTKDGLVATFSVIFDKRMILMAPICIYSGMTGGYFCGALPQATRDATWIALAFVVYGVAEILGSVSFGKGNDLLGRRLMLYLTILVHALAIISSLTPIYFLTGYTTVTYDEKGQPTIHTVGNPATICISFFFWGLADAALNTSLYSIIPAKSMFADILAAGFSVMKLYQAASAALMFFICMFFKDLLVVFQVILVVLLILGTICCILLECLFVRFDEKKNSDDDFETPRSKGRKTGGEPKGIVGKLVSRLPMPPLPDVNLSVSVLEKLPFFGKK